MLGRNTTTGSLQWAYAPQETLPAPNEAWNHWATHMVELGVLKPGQRFAAASYPTQDRDLIWFAPGKTLSPWTACGVENPYNTDWSKNSKHYDPVEDWLYHEWNYHQGRGDNCDLDGLQEDWDLHARHEFGAYNMVQRMRLEAEKLPLIVLAGLK